MEDGGLNRIIILKSPQEIGWDGVDWIDLVRDRDKRQGPENGNKPSCSIKYGKFLTSLMHISF